MKRTIAITLALGGVATAAFLWSRQDTAAVDVVAAPLSPYIPSTPKVVVAGEEPTARPHGFVASDDAFVADGVRVDADGTVTFSAQKDGTRLVQTPLAARIVSKTKLVEDLPAQPATGVMYEQKDASSVIFKDRLGSVDLEYRYDGVQMEEFFHVDAELTAQLAAAGNDLEVSSRFPTLTEAAGAVLLDDATGAPLFLANSGGSDAQMITKVEHFGSARVRMSNDVEFMLPPSVAIDAKGERKELKRHFEVQDGTLVATTVLDHAWLKTATGPIAIDPSVIEVGSVDINNFNNATNIVRDSTGTLHVVYKQGSRLRYARGDGNAFQVIATIDAGDVCRVDDRHPALVIDSTDTLHLVFTSNINNTLPPGNNNTSRLACARYSMATTVGANQLRVLISSCRNRCQGDAASLAPWSKPIAVAYGHRAGASENTPGLVETGRDANSNPVLETFGNTDCARDDRFRNFYVNTVVVDRSDRLHIGMMKHHDWAFNSFLVTRNPNGTYVRPGCTGAFAQNADPIHGLDELSVDVDREGNVLLFSVPENYYAHHGNFAYSIASQSAPAVAQVKIFNPDTRQYVHNTSNSENPPLEFDPRRPSTSAPAETSVPQYLIDTRAAQRDRDGVLHVFYTIRPIVADPVAPADWCENVPKLRHAWLDTRVTPPRFEVETPFSSHTDCGKGELNVKAYYTKSNKVRLFYTQCVTTPGTGTVAHAGTANGCTAFFAEATAAGPMGPAQLAVPVEVESHFQANAIGQPFPASAQMVDDYELVYIQRKRNVNTMLFFKSAPDVDAARLIGPSNHSWVAVAQPTFEFAPVVRDQGNGVFRYRLEVSTSPSFAALEYFEDNLIATGFGEPIRRTATQNLSDVGPSKGIFYWRVVPRQGAAGTPEASFAAIREIGVDLRAPQAFSLIRPGCPVDAAGVKLDPACNAAPGANPTFEWQAAQDE